MVDLKLNGKASGLTCVQTLHAHDPEMLIVVLTGFASIATAVEAIKLGACHYLAKPSNTDDIEAAFGRAEGSTEVELTNRADLDQDARVGAHPRDAGRDRLQHLGDRAPAGHAPAHAGAQAGKQRVKIRACALDRRPTTTMIGRFIDRGIFALLLADEPCGARSPMESKPARRLVQLEQAVGTLKAVPAPAV